MIDVNERYDEVEDRYNLDAIDVAVLKVDCMMKDVAEALKAKDYVALRKTLLLVAKGALLAHDVVVATTPEVTLVSFSTRS